MNFKDIIDFLLEIKLNIKYKKNIKKHKKNIKKI